MLARFGIRPIQIMRLTTPFTKPPTPLNALSRQSFSSSSKQILGAAIESKKVTAPTESKLNHILAFSNNEIGNPAESFVTEDTIRAGCRAFKVGDVPGAVIAKAFIRSLESTGAKPIAPGCYSVRDAATYGGHPGAVGFFGPNGIQRLQELKGFCPEINGELILFQSTYKEYAALVNENINARTEKGFSCMQRFFGQETAQGEKYLTFSKIDSGEMYNPKTKRTEKYVKFSDFEQLIRDTRVIKMEVQAGQLPRNRSQK